MAGDNLDLDLNDDGVVDQRELSMYEAKMKTQRRMAVVAMIALVATGLYLAFFATADRLLSMGGVLDLFFVTLGTIISFYFGASAYTSVNSPPPGGNRPPRGPRN